MNWFDADKDGLAKIVARQDVLLVQIQLELDPEQEPREVTPWE